MQTITTTITGNDAGSRLDRWFKRHYPHINHGFLEKALRKGLIRLDGKKTSSNTRVEEGQLLTIAAELAKVDETHASAPKPKTISDRHKQMLLDAVLHKDENIIVLNKPAGLAVQGGSKITTSLDAMLDALCFGNSERPKLVHRLDKDTSGVLLLARNSKAAAALTQAFRHKDIQKIYWAVVLGRAPKQEGSIHVPLAKNANPSGYEQVEGDVEKGEFALTHYRVMESAQNIVSWLELRPVTGRTHQLRVHCKSIGTPILGDGKYGGRQSFIKGLPPKMNLHARQLILPDLFGKQQIFTAPLPSHMKETWEMFGFRDKK